MTDEDIDLSVRVLSKQFDDVQKAGAIAQLDLIRVASRIDETALLLRETITKAHHLQNQIADLKLMVRNLANRKV